MSDVVDDNGFDTDAQDRVRAEVRRIAGRKPMTVVAQEAGVAYGTFSSWMGGTYNGNTSRIAGEAKRWCDAQATKQQARAAMPASPGFIETTSAKRFISGLETAQYEPDFVLIAGGAGVGKTSAIERYRATNPNVWMLTGEPCFATPRMLLDSLAEVMGISEKYSSQKISRAIQARVRGSGGLLILDEAQHLSSSGLDQMRTLFDLTNVGVALVGNETVYTRLEGHGRQAQFAQLFRRVGLRVNRPKPHADDIEQLLDGHGVSEPTIRKMLTQIAHKPGALGNLTKTLKRAHMLAGDAGVTPDTIRRAWENISGTKLLMEAA